MTPTPLATLPAGCVNILINGDFELDGSWIFGRDPIPAKYTGAQIHGGVRAVQLGNPPDSGVTNKVSFSSIRQHVVLPGRGLTAQLRWWHYYGTEEAVDPNPTAQSDRQEVMLLSPNGRALRIIRRVRNNDSGWVQDSADITEFMGQSFYLYFNVFNDSNGSRTWMYLDDVELSVCYPPATATAPPTATYTPSPTPTITPTPSITPTPTDTPTMTPTGPCSCASDTLNCSDFSTQPEAQACYNYCESTGHGDIHRLDGDNNGLACQSLPVTVTATLTPTPTPTPTDTPTLTPTPTGPCTCESDTYNCSDFSTQPEAQACYNYCKDTGHGDIHRLDGNNNGRACESLPMTVTASALVFPPAAAAAQAPQQAPAAVPLPGQASPVVPTLAPNQCIELVNNGDFEAAGPGWNLLAGADPPVYVTDNTFNHSGQAMQLGILGDMRNQKSISAVDQTIYLPAAAPSIVLSFRYYPIYDVPPGPGDLQYVDIYNALTGQFANRVLGVQQNDRTWLAKTFDLTALAGQPIRLFFAVNNDGVAGRTAMILDSVSIQACNITATVTPVPPTATAANTPVNDPSGLAATPTGDLGAALPGGSLAGRQLGPIRRGPHLVGALGCDCRVGRHLGRDRLCGLGHHRRVETAGLMTRPGKQYAKDGFAHEKSQRGQTRLNTPG